MTNTYIFDLDGTILNSSPDILKCINLSLEECGFAEKIADESVIGPPIAKILEKAVPSLSESGKSQVISCFRKKYDEPHEDISYVYPGINELLIKLKNRSESKLIIATNKPYIPTMRIIKFFSLDYFDCVYCGDHPSVFKDKQEMVSSLIKNEHIDTKETIFVGDTDGDLLVASQNNIRFIGVEWGYEKDKTKLRTFSYKFVSSPSELQRELV